MKYVIFIVIAFLTIGCEHKGAKIPSFDLQLIDTTKKFNTSSIPEGKPIALLYFSPDCSHCQKETESIIANMDSLKDVRFYFITNDPYERMWTYDKMFKLYKYKNILVGRDYKYFFPGFFKNVAPPYLVICDEYKRVRGIFPGELPVSPIISYINKL